jgi:hypothetical protein
MLLQTLNYLPHLFRSRIATIPNEWKRRGVAEIQIEVHIGKHRMIVILQGPGVLLDPVIPLKDPGFSTFSNASWPWGVAKIHLSPRCATLTVWGITNITPSTSTAETARAIFRGESRNQPSRMIAGNALEAIR